ncbi:Clp protease N-terminal domain-containing protein [Auraticoccus monumenti]|uniref:Clp amino terminal domain-containing protein, pathogenicity island component n=1 Tax=Auraticoccus monumenti TaxID=675864 RepID=A0A1G6SVS9_9ACTN|nr:Clp protease N-terminal domain-containing protein [Auraticoccus monumenti]SDD20821.1 Clp amino terminal domain-containing protein, pathogenicity island component [Auraticoccus monumenti]
MFERFSAGAKQVVVLAQEDARGRGQSTVRSENLLVCLAEAVHGPDTAAAELLTALGMGAVDVRAAVDRLPGAAGPAPDGDRLARLGIDLDEVRTRVEESFGPGALERTAAAQRKALTGHIPFDAGARQSLEHSLREALELGDRRLGTEHVLLGVARAEGGAGHHLLAAAGITSERLRAEVRRRRLAAG